jgi:hypothetical protein
MGDFVLHAKKFVLEVKISSVDFTEHHIYFYLFYHTEIDYIH